MFLGWEGVNYSLMDTGIEIWENNLFSGGGAHQELHTSSNQNTITQLYIAIIIPIANRWIMDVYLPSRKIYINCLFNVQCVDDHDIQEILLLWGDALKNTKPQWKL